MPKMILIFEQVIRTIPRSIDNRYAATKCLFKFLSLQSHNVRRLSAGLIFDAIICTFAKIWRLSGLLKTFTITNSFQGQ